MSDLDEYTFFRHRYNIAQNKQTALVVLTDAAIRRWCSPKWRIGTARRTFAAAAMSHMQAAWLDEGTAFDLSLAQSRLQDWIPDIGTITVTEAGITSSVYGNLSYMTPITELAIDKVLYRNSSSTTVSAICTSGSGETSLTLLPFASCMSRTAHKST
jgi:hypothetical protein